MKKISEVISMPVISLYESEFIGIVYNIMIDRKSKKINYACVMNEEENIPYLINFSNIYKIGKNCIFIKNKSHIELESNCCRELEKCINPINLNIYNINGELIGKSKDIVLNNNNQFEKILTTNDFEIPLNQIFNMSKDLILVDEKFTKINIFRPKLKIAKKPKTIEKVFILDNEIEKKIDSNAKIITDSKFLIGRELNKDIIAMNGEIIAKKGSIVTKEIIKNASYFGRLIDISRYS